MKNLLAGQNVKLGNVDYEKIISHAVQLTASMIHGQNFTLADVQSALAANYAAVLDLCRTAGLELMGAHKMPWEETIFDDGLISFIDGKKYRNLGMHLRRYGMTAEQYRARFGLPVSYPMLCKEMRNIMAERGRRMVERGLIRPGRFGARKLKDVLAEQAAMQAADHAAEHAAEHAGAQEAGMQTAH